MAVRRLVTSVSPGAGEKMSKFIIRGGDIPALLACFGDLQRKAEARTEQWFRVMPPAHDAVSSKADIYIGWPESVQPSAFYPNYAA